jgi:hypothetical protein
MSGSRLPDVREASVQYYIDADTLGLAHILASIRPDVTFPGDPGGVIRKRSRPPSPIASTDVPDEEWIPVVASRGWTVITRDQHIERRPAERASVIANSARVVAITSSEKLTVWHQLEIVMTRWRDIEKVAGIPGPSIHSITRTSVRRLL